jgi:hypothetical protein
LLKPPLCASLRNPFEDAFFAKIISEQEWLIFVEEFFDGDYRISAAGEDRLRNSRRIDAQTFALALAEARGIANPEYEITMLRGLKRKFIARFGTNSVAVAAADG